MPVLRPSGSDFTSFVKAAAQYVPAGRTAKVSKSGGVSVSLPGLGAIIRTSQVGALASPTTSAVVINGITPPAGGGGGTAPVPIPSSVSGLQLWLDGRDVNGTNQAVASGSLTTWTDKSGYTRNATSWPNAPYYTSNVGAQFTYTSTQGLISYIPAGVFSSGVTMFLVFQKNGGSYIPAYVDGDGLISRTVSNLASPFDVNGTVRIIGKNSQPQGNINGSNISTFTSNNVWCATITNGSVYNEYSNGTNTISATASPAYYDDVASNVTIGTRYDQYVFFNGVISEVVMYNTALNTTQRQKIEGYLAWKWGLQSTLPAGHPFKTAAPTA